MVRVREEVDPTVGGADLVEDEEPIRGTRSTRLPPEWEIPYTNSETGHGGNIPGDGH